MATTNEEIIYSIKLDVSSTKEGIEEFTKVAINAKKANEDLKTSQSESVAASERQATAAKKTTEAVKAEEGSIAAIREANKKLTQERNNTTVATEAGRKKVEELNKKLDENNAAIKDNVDSVTKQKLNIGNYASAIDKLIPGFDGLSQAVSGMKTFVQGATTSIGGMSTAMKVLLGPIGLIIAGIGLFVSWLTRTEEGGDLVAKVIAQVGAAFNVLLDRTALLGGALSKLFTGDFSGALDDASKAVSGLTDEMAREVKTAGELADVLDELEDRERSNKVALSESTLEIKRLVLESKNRLLTEQQKIDLLKQASELEIKSNETSKQIALDHLKASTRQIESDFSQYNITKKKTESEEEYARRIVDDSRLTGAARDKVAESIVALNQIEGESINIQEKISNQIDAQNLKRKERIEKINEEIKKVQERALKQDEADSKILLSQQKLNEKISEIVDAQIEKDNQKIAKLAINAANDTIEKRIQLDNQVVANQEAIDKVLAAQDKADEQRLAKYEQNTKSILGLTSFLSNGITQIAKQQADLQLQDLTISTNQQLAVINDKYDKEAAALNSNLDNEVTKTTDIKKKISETKAAFDSADLAFKISINNAATDDEAKALKTQQDQLKLNYDIQNLALQSKLDTQADAQAKQQSDLKALQEKQKEETLAIQKEQKRQENEIKKRAFDANKKNQITESIVDTVQSGIAAFRSLAGIPFVGPVLGAIAAAAALAFGYKNVEQIKSQQFVPGFATGGRTLSGQRIGANHGTPINRSNGDNILATVKKGEVILNERHQAMLGGDQTFKRMGIPGFATSGLVGDFGNPIETILANSNSRNNDMLTETKVVLILEQFEAKQLAKSRAIDKAEVL